MPLVKGLDFFEQKLSALPHLPAPYKCRADGGLRARPICASIAIFCSRPDAAAKIYASEIRIALSSMRPPATSLLGDPHSSTNTGVDLNTYATNFERFFNMLGLTDAAIHEEPRYYESRRTRAAGILRERPRRLHAAQPKRSPPSTPAHFLN
ncbi:MAG: hypothetical protein V8T25_01325 [Sutterella wadsworthensis]